MTKHPRAALDGYAPIDYARHARDYRRAVAGRGPWYDEVLVEDHGEYVTILPSDATPYPGRVVWRRVRVVNIAPFAAPFAPFEKSEKVSTNEQ